MQRLFIYLSILKKGSINKENLPFFIGLKPLWYHHLLAMYRSIFLIQNISQKKKEIDVNV